MRGQAAVFVTTLTTTTARLVTFRRVDRRDVR
jgi:hypothetical protein